MRKGSKYITLALIGFILIFISLSLGTEIITPFKMFDIFTGNSKGVYYNIIFNIRIPRVFMTLIIGASLGLSGLIFQAILKNPLAEPYLIGVSGGAAFGATIAIILSLSYHFTVIFAFSGSLASITSVYAISRRMKIGTTSLVLAGIAISFILSSTVLLLFSLSKSEQVHKAVMWLMGDLSIARYSNLKWMSILTIFLIILIMMFYKHLNIISFGDKFSKNLGVSENNIRFLFWIAALLAAISVSLCGVIGFVGLIVPHVMRNIFGPDHLKLIPVVSIGGALFLLISDTIGRSIAPPYEIPVGIITGFFGGIFFLLFMIKKWNHNEYF